MGYHRRRLRLELEMTAIALPFGKGRLGGLVVALSSWARAKAVIMIGLIRQSWNREMDKKCAC